MEPENSDKETDSEIKRDRLLAKLKEGERAVLIGKTLHQDEARKKMSRWVRKSENPKIRDTPRFTSN